MTVVELLTVILHSSGVDSETLATGLDPAIEDPPALLIESMLGRSSDEFTHLIRMSIRLLVMLAIVRATPCLSALLCHFYGY